jgi:hypothetical protein
MIAANDNWHPSVLDMTYAHCHAYAAPPGTRRLHLPTDFITVREIVRWLMRDFGVYPLVDQWERAVDEAGAVLLESLRWAIPHP